MDYKTARKHLEKVFDYENIIKNTMGELDIISFGTEIMGKTPSTYESGGLFSYDYIDFLIFLDEREKVILYDNGHVSLQVDSHISNFEIKVFSVSKKTIDVLCKLYCGGKYEDLLLSFFGTRRLVKQAIERFPFAKFCADFVTLTYNDNDDDHNDQLESQTLHCVIENGVVAEADEARIERGEKVYYSKVFDTLEKIKAHFEYEKRMKEASVFYDEIPQASSKARLNNIQKMDTALNFVFEFIVKENDKDSEYVDFVFYLVPKKDFFERLEQDCTDYEFPFRTLMEQKSHLPVIDFCHAVLVLVLSTLYLGEANMSHPPLSTRILLLRDLKKDEQNGM